MNVSEIDTLACLLHYIILIVPDVKNLPLPVLEYWLLILDRNVNFGNFWGILLDNVLSQHQSFARIDRLDAFPQIADRARAIS